MSGTCVHAGDPCPGTQCATCQETTETCLDPPGTTCNDGDPSTRDDRCDGLGTCSGTSILPDYVILRWPPPGSSSALVVKGAFSAYSCLGAIPNPIPDPSLHNCDNATGTPGKVCTDTAVMKKKAVAGAHIIARSGTPTYTVKLTDWSHVRGMIVTRGKIKKGEFTVVDGVEVPQDPGTHIELVDCDAAGDEVANRFSLLGGLPASPQLTIGSVLLLQGMSRTIPDPVDFPDGFPAGQVVVEISDIQLKPAHIEHTRLTLKGGPLTDTVIVHITGKRGLRLSSLTDIVLDGLTPEQVIFVLDQGPAKVGAKSTFSGTILARNVINVSADAVVNGQLFGGKRIKVNPRAYVNHHPWTGW